MPLLILTPALVLVGYLSRLHALRGRGVDRLNAREFLARRRVGGAGKAGRGMQTRLSPESFHNFFPVLTFE